MSLELLSWIKPWLLPPGSLLLVLLVGLLLGRRFSGRLLLILAIVLLYLLSIPQTSAWLARPLETDASASAAEIGTAGGQAIVVLLAGRTHRAPELGGKDGLSALSLQRLHHGVRLHRQTGLPLVLSGGAAPDEPDGEGLAILAERALHEVYGVEAMLTEASSRTTRENAIHTAAALRQRGIDTVVLVTHAWHMPRALYSAEQAGLKVIPAGTAFVSTQVDQGGAPSDWLPSAKALALNRNLLHEHLGGFWYRYGP